MDRPPRGRLLAACLSLLVATVVVFGPTLRHGFVWDDHEQVVDNEHLRRWASFPEFWKKDILELSRQGGELHSNYYRPLFYSQYLLYYQAFGLAAPAWHAMALLHHALAGGAALLLLLRLGFPLSIAWAAALLFILHPAHGESVSWVAAAFNDPPAATLVMLGLAAHATWIRSGRLGHLLLGPLAYAAALCLKESALSMLLLVPLVSAFLVRPGVGHGRAPASVDRISRRRWPHLLAYGVAYGVYAAVTAAYFVARSFAIGTAFGVYTGARSLAEIAPTFPWLALFYLRLLLWPLGLSPSYPLRLVPDWSDPRAWGGLIAVAVFVLFIVLATRRRPVHQFAALWTAFCIWPVFNIRSFLPTYLAHQRYLYLAVLGLCLAVAWALFRAPVRPAVRSAALAALVVIWAGSNLHYNRAWATDAALWTRIGEVDPQNPAGFDWRGAQAMKEGRLEEAEALFRRAVAADATSPFGYRNLAVLYHARRGRPELALPWYERAIERFRGAPAANEDEFLECLMNYGICLAELGRRDEALGLLAEIAEAPPYPPRAAESAAVLLLEAGELSRVEEVLRRAIERHPEHPRLLTKLADFYLRTGRPLEAHRFAAELLRVAPGSTIAAALVARAEAALAAESESSVASPPPPE